MNDTDLDGYGDNASGNDSDMCPTVVGTSSMIDSVPDTDLDGYSDSDLQA